MIVVTLPMPTVQLPSFEGQANFQLNPQVRHFPDSLQFRGHWTSVERTKDPPP